MAVRPLHTRVVFWLLSACLGLVLWTYLSTPARPSASSSSSVAPVLAHDGRTPISYDLTSPPTADPCYDIIYDGQRRLVEAYRELLKGITHVFILGHLGTENKGDSAIWVGQQVLLAHLGITIVGHCRAPPTDRFPKARCTLEDIEQALDVDHPAAQVAIMIAGGGNFNSFYWPGIDQWARHAVVDHFPHIPIRSFPQSVWLGQPERTAIIADHYSKHPDMHLAARDAVSYQVLKDNFGQYPNIKLQLLPDIATMHGPIPRLREAPKDVLFFERKDRESSGFSGDRLDPGPEENNVHNGTYTLESGRKITYTTGDWSKITTPRAPIKYKDAAKTFIGFDFLDSGKIVVTDRLHGIILSTLKGVPHIIFDSLLGKNKAYHDTWYKNCPSGRVVESWEQVESMVNMFLDAEEAE